MTYLLYHKAYFLIGFLSLISYLSFGQNQKLADSLKEQYHSGVFTGSELNILETISEGETN